MTKRLVLPASAAEIRSLRAGDAVAISGLVLTGRDRLHKHFADGGAMPEGFRGGALYHCGPVIVREGAAWRVAAAGPTTSSRENQYEPDFIAATGVRVIVGKGGMDAATLAAMKRYGCIYVQATGGAAAVAAACVKRVAGVSLLDEFGSAEACWQLEVENFPGIVAMDAHGASLFDAVAKTSAARLDALFHA